MSRPGSVPLGIPPWTLGVLSVVAFAITAILAFSTFTSDRAFRRLTEQDLAILDSLGTIVHMD